MAPGDTGSILIIDGSLPFIDHNKLSIDGRINSIFYLDILLREHNKAPFEYLKLIIMGKLIKFGEEVNGYQIPVLNEREIRASAGILLLATYTALMLILLKGNFLVIKYVITFFLLDFIIRVFISPRFSPTLIIGRWIVSGQNPEYVGAQQKKFAWIIGVLLSGTMFILMVLVNSYSPITGIICLICLIFLFFESAFGICLGCKFYPIFYKKKAQYCPGEVCDVKTRQPIQKISAAQAIIVLAFLGFIIGSAFLFNDQFKKRPHNLFQVTKPIQSVAAKSQN